jgi:protein-disulfide isomerase
MADAGDSKSPALYGCVGSTPTSGTRSSRRAEYRAASHSRDNLRAVTSRTHGNALRNPPARWTLATIVLLGAFAIAPGCATRNAAPEAAPVTTAAAPAPTPVPTVALTGPQMAALERAAGSTPPLRHDVEPAPAPVAGLGGTPGPSPGFGPENAPVRIFLFTDFQCGVCPRVVEPVKYLARAYPDDVRLVLKQNALASHGRAARLAAASLAAFRQSKFWEFHDRLFASPARNTDQDLVAIAQAIGLDVARFQADMDDEAVTEQVKYESELAVSLGLPGTPGLVVNGRLEKGWASTRGFESLIKREIARARAIADSGVPAGRVAYEATRQSGPQGEQLASALFAASR